ncbi:hypothetical protein L2E82_47261 [Cichorium intybus]|uniref:Uncharacterized protein n=1 Tax=Cichorium intybus TaxID=13427 RepID=A0ACB8YVK0_CICIN|nr:hypothetical protein L2E82_47261 [Cichorium intybus]
MPLNYNKKIDGFLYETLYPLSTNVAVSAPVSTPPPAPSPPSDSKPYLVLRNHIPISTNSTPLPETSAPEFFSLDVDADADADDWRTPTPPLKRSRLATPLPDEEPKRSLEVGWFRANCRFKSPMLQLHKEILDFCDFLSPTPEEQVSRDTAVESVSHVIKYIWPKCKVEVFGSFKTGLFLPSSDVDMVILESQIRTPQLGLHALSRALSQRGVAKKIQQIDDLKQVRGGFVELYVERVQDADQGLQKVALESISELFTDYFHLHFSPGDTPWDGGTFKLTLQFSEDYPIYADGSICLDILQNQWSPIYDVAAILTSIQFNLVDLDEHHAFEIYFMVGGFMEVIMALSTKKLKKEGGLVAKFTKAFPQI